MPIPGDGVPRCTLLLGLCGAAHAFSYGGHVDGAVFPTSVPRAAASSLLPAGLELAPLPPCNSVGSESCKGTAATHPLLLIFTLMLRIGLSLHRYQPPRLLPPPLAPPTCRDARRCAVYALHVRRAHCRGAVRPVGRRPRAGVCVPRPVHLPPALVPQRVAAGAARPMVGWRQQGEPARPADARALARSLAVRVLGRRSSRRSTDRSYLHRRARRRPEAAPSACRARTGGMPRSSTAHRHLGPAHSLGSRESCTHTPPRAAGSRASGSSLPRGLTRPSASPTRVRSQSSRATSRRGALTAPACARRSLGTAGLRLARPRAGSICRPSAATLPIAMHPLHGGACPRTGIPRRQSCFPSKAPSPSTNRLLRARCQWDPWTSHRCERGRRAGFACARRGSTRHSPLTAPKRVPIRPRRPSKIDLASSAIPTRFEHAAE